LAASRDKSTCSTTTKQNKTTVGRQNMLDHGCMSGDACMHPYRGVNTCPWCANSACCQLNVHLHPLHPATRKL
jgi:hypothetical protein